MCRIIFHFFCFFYAEMRRKRPDVQKFSSLLYTYKFVKETKLKKFTIEPKSYTAMLLYLFFDSLLSTCPKKMETEKWPKAADFSRLVSIGSSTLFANFQYFIASKVLDPMFPNTFFSYRFSFQSVPSRVTLPLDVTNFFFTSCHQHNFFFN